MLDSCDGRFPAEPAQFELEPRTGVSGCVSEGSNKRFWRLTRQLPWVFDVSWSAVSRWVGHYRMQKAASAGARKDGRASRIRHVGKEPARRPRD